MREIRTHGSEGGGANQCTVPTPIISTPGVVGVGDLAAVGFDEFLRLDEHAAGPTARVVHPALVGGEHFDQQAEDAAGRVELAAFLALSADELR